MSRKSLVPKAGIEPARGFPQRILSSIHTDHNSTTSTLYVGQTRPHTPARAISLAQKAHTPKRLSVLAALLLLVIVPTILGCEIGERRELDPYCVNAKKEYLEATTPPDAVDGPRCASGYCFEYWDWYRSGLQTVRFVYGDRVDGCDTAEHWAILLP